MKKVLYIAIAIFFWLMVSFILHAVVEMFILAVALKEGWTVEGTYFLGLGWCALPVWMQYSFAVLGVVVGYLIGQRWWNFVYVQKKHPRFQGKKKKELKESF